MKDKTENAEGLNTETTPQPQNGGSAENVRTISHKALPAKWNKLILCAVAVLGALALLRGGCSRGHLYEFDGGVINLANVSTVKTGMRFQICYENSGETAFSIGYAKDNTPIDVPINKENIAKIKKAIRENSKYHIFTVGGRASIKFDGFTVHLPAIEKGWTWDGLERTVDSWLDEAETVFDRVK